MNTYEHYCLVFNITLYNIIWKVFNMVLLHLTINWNKGCRIDSSTLGFWEDPRRVG